MRFSLFSCTRVVGIVEHKTAPLCNCCQHNVYGLAWSDLVCSTYSALAWSELFLSGLVKSSPVLSGLVWSAMVWYGLVWSGLACLGLVWSGLIYLVWPGLT